MDQLLPEFLGNFLMDHDQLCAPQRVFYFETVDVHTSVIVLIQLRHELGVICWFHPGESISIVEGYSTFCCRYASYDSIRSLV